jgi:hypothetical protein
MTMRLTIKNEDSQRTGHVRVFEGVTESASEKKKLPPGAEQEFWIHSGRHLVVEEVQEEEITKVPA